jgi:hypothetical protein
MSTAVARAVSDPLASLRNNPRPYYVIPEPQQQFFASEAPQAPQAPQVNLTEDSGLKRRTDLHAD